ncbi:MAG: sugar phosphate isomerase/epimerase [Bacteroidota bacterium]|nr:sugar phosphate isomerase/epimerase [Bacteroidota bacterium]
MTTRRSFLKTTSVLSAGLLMAPSEFKMKAPVIGLQLYTVRDAMDKDPKATLAKVSKIGYNSVEGATYTGTEKFYGMSPKEFSKVLKDNGLIIPSSHYRLGEEKDKGQLLKGTMLNDWNKAIHDAAEVGIKYMVCAYLSDAERGKLDHYKYVADQLNIAGEKCKKAGIQLCYHNHDFEFIKQDDKYPYDILMSSDKDLVKMEMDIYWIKKAGQDPIALFKKHPGRYPLWHAKDMDNTPERAFTEVGNGIIDFKEIFKYKKLAGMKYFFVEQDKCPGSPFDSIAQSIKYIKKNLV